MQQHIRLLWKPSFRVLSYLSCPSFPNASFFLLHHDRVYPQVHTIITNSTDVGRFAKAFGSIYLYKVLRRSAYIPHDLDLECAYMREYTSVYRDHRLSVGDAVSIYVWRKRKRSCLCIYSELFNIIAVLMLSLPRLLLHGWEITMYMCVRCRNPVFPVAKGYYRTLRRHLIFEEPYPCFGS